MGELADRLARGERAAFAELYDACADRLHPYLVARLGSRTDADDVVQETFVRLARNRSKLAGVENLVAYVFTVARNESARLISRSQREETIRVVRAELAASCEPAPPDLEAREVNQLLTTALQRLSPEQREVVELKTYGQLTLREIAEITSLPPGTVATRYRTALTQLRRWLPGKIHHE